MIYLNDKPVEFGRYPNGETVVPDIAVSGRSVNVRWQYDGDHEFLQLVLIRGLIRQQEGGMNVYAHLFLDYMPYSRMDREQDGHCFSLQHVVNQIASLRWASVTVVEPHSDVTGRLFGKQFGIVFKEAWATAPNLKKTMEAVGFDPEHDYLVLPDAGAVDRYSALPGSAEIIRVSNLIAMRKKRDFNTGKIQGVEVDSITTRGLATRPTSGRRALILDDLTSRGGTFVATARVLRHSTLRFQYVDLLVTHMEPVATEGELPAQMDSVYVCDTMPIKNPLPPNFHIIPREDWL